MKLEYLGQTTLLTDVCSPIDFNAITEHNKSTRLFNPTEENKSKLISIDQICQTENLRIILKGELDQRDAETLNKLSGKYKKTRIVRSCKLANHDFLRCFTNLYGIQISGFVREDYPSLDLLPQSLKEISISFVPNKPVSLAPLLIFDDLKTIRLQGKIEDVDAINKYNNLEIVSLGYMQISSFEFLKDMNCLKDLYLRHGSVNDYSHLKDLRSLKSIYLWKVKGIRDLEFLKSLINLKKIEIGALANVNALPLFENLDCLEYVKIEQLNSLESIANISKSESVKKVHICKMNKLSLEDYESFVDHPSLIELTTGYSGKKNRKIVSDLLGLPMVKYEPHYLTADF